MSRRVNGLSEVDDLGPDALLRALSDADRREREAARDKLVLAHQWCVLHPATADTGVAVWGGANDLEADESLGGDGTPLVAAFTPEPFGIALGVSTDTAKTLLADALDLVHRLPQVWRRVQTLEVPAWRARRIAQKTHPLSVKAAAQVDRVLAPRLHTVGVTLIDRAVAQAIAKHLPEEHANREERARQTWDVTLHHPNPTEYAGTSELHITGDTLTLTNLYDQVCATAADLKTAGDPDPLGVRKAKALGTLTAATPKTKLYLHLDLADLADRPDLEVSSGSATETRVGWVERLGPVSLTRIRAWVGSARVTVQPVLRVPIHSPP